MAPSFSSKVVMVLVMSLFYTLKTLEILVNPNTSTVVCGTDDDCAVICNVEQSCLSKTFYFYNNAIYLECSATYACEDITIYSANTKLLNINATDAYALVSGKLFSSVTDTDITVTCGFSACENAIFYYLNNGESKHMCTSNLSCRKTVIKAVSTVSLFCDTSRSCYRTSFILPTDNASHQQSSLTVTDGGAPSDHTIKLLSLYPFINFISTDGSTLNGIHFVFGARFDEYCIVSDQSCMDSVQNKISEYDNLTIIDTYVDGFESLQANYTGDLLIFLTKNHSNIFEPPSISYTNVLSIVCIYCTDVIFLLEHIQNAVLSVGGTRSWRMKIYGSRDVFTLNVMHFVGDNEYFLNNTNTIEVNSLGRHSEIHLGNALDVHINCQTEGNLYYPCPSGDGAINLWSTLHENEIRLATSTTEYWNIDTPSPILIHFDFEQYACEYQNYSSNCSFLTISPTRNPTESSANPTSIPSIDPTNAPSNNPSDYPTNNPISEPTTDPTTKPTEDTILINVIETTHPSLGLRNTNTSLPNTSSRPQIPVQGDHLDTMPMPITMMIGIICAVLLLCLLSAWCLNVLKKKKSRMFFHLKTLSALASHPHQHDIYNHNNDYDAHLIHWLNETVELPQYIHNFVQNGYINLHKIQDIESKSELNEIGIVMKGHQTLIILEIGKLRIKGRSMSKAENEVKVEREMMTIEGIAEVKSNKENDMDKATIGNNDAGNPHMNTTRNAMINDKIVQGVISTRRGSIANIINTEQHETQS